MLPGTFPIHDLDDIGVELPDGDYATVAGLLLENLGRIPIVGDSVTVVGWKIEVREMERHSITEVALTEVAPIDVAPPSPPPAPVSSDPTTEELS